MNYFSVNKKFVKVYLIELLFILLIIGSLFAWINFTESRFEDAALKINTIDYENLESLESAKSNMIFNLIYSFVGAFILLFALLALFSITRLAVFSIIWKKKIKKIFFKFMILKILWTVLWSPLLLIFLTPLFLLSGNVTLFYIFVMLMNFTLFLSMSYFGLFLYKDFLEHKKYYRAITHAFPKAIKGLKKTAVPIIGSSAIFFIFTIILIALEKFRISFALSNLLIFLYFYTGCKIWILTKMSH